MRYCGQCGASAPASNRFCGACGERFASAAAEPSQPIITAAVQRLAAGDNEGSLAALAEYDSSQPGYPVALAYRGLAKLRLARVADAREDFLEAVRLAPDSFICRAKYAEYLARLGFFDQAAEELGVALSLPAPDSRSEQAARELRQHCLDKAKGIYYKRLAYPKFSRLVPRGLFSRRTAIVQEGR